LYDLNRRFRRYYGRPGRTLIEGPGAAPPGRKNGHRFRTTPTEMTRGARDEDAASFAA
jgi:hypothetical protein